MSLGRNGLTVFQRPGCCPVFFDRSDSPVESGCFCSRMDGLVQSPSLPKIFSERRDVASVPARRAFPRSTGFTLVELMVAIAVLAILLTVGIPSFSEMVRNNRLTTNANDFLTALNLAKSEAIKRGLRVTLRGAAPPNWESGWEVFTDTDGSGTRNGADESLRVYGPFQGVYTLRGNGNFVNFVSFLPTGRSSSSIGGSFALCENSDGNNLPEARTARLLVINAMGRVRFAVDQNNNGIPEKDDGTDLASCINP